jgi:uncharacterized metal-binding protein
MASGRTHDRITLWTLPLVLLAAFRLTLDGWLTATVCLGFLLGGWVLGPDLDIHSVQYKRWGWFRWIWLLYRGSLRHRSLWSHGPLIGTMVRVLYTSIWLALLGIITVDVLNSLGRTTLSWGDLVAGLSWNLRTYWPFWLALLIGLEVGALSHYMADWLTSAWKRRAKQGSASLQPPSKGARPKKPRRRRKNR